jgi:hypothetical protein
MIGNVANDRLHPQVNGGTDEKVQSKYRIISMLYLIQRQCPGGEGQGEGERASATSESRPALNLMAVQRALPPGRFGNTPFRPWLSLFTGVGIGLSRPRPSRADGHAMKPHHVRVHALRVNRVPAKLAKHRPACV